MKRHLITRAQKAALIGAATFFFGVASFITFSGRAATAGDCSANAIVTCGASSASDLVAKIQANKSGDLQTIYAAYGLAPADYSRFASQAKLGTLYQNGEVKVDGRTVGTNGKSIGRSAKSYSHPVTIGGHTYHESNSTDVMQSNATVMVLFDANGMVETVVINDCGNPVKVVPVAPPTAACQQLLITPTADKNKYLLKVTATTSATGVAIRGYNFAVRNAAGTLVDSTSTQTAEKSGGYTTTLPGPGTYKVIGSVRTNLGTKESPACNGTITIAPEKQPAAECKQLTAAPTADRLKYTMTAAATVADGATVKGYTYTVKDSTGKVVVSKAVTSAALTDAQEVSVAGAGTYTASVSVQTSLGNKESTACATQFTVADQPTPKTPNVTIEKKVDGVESKQVAVGQNFTYQVTVKNTGEVDLKNVAVTDPAPAGVTMLSADKGAIAANKWSYTIPELKVGAAESYAITAKVAEYKAGNIVNTACVNAPEVHPTEPAKNDACDDATVNVPPVTLKNPAISIEKSVDGKEDITVNVQQVFTYQVTVKNTGEVDLKNVAVTDPAPAGVTMLSADKGEVKDNKWTYVIPELKTGASLSFAITAKVAEYKAGALLNTACVNAPEVNQGEPAKDDACDTAIVRVTPPAVTPPTPPAPTPTPTPVAEGKVLPNTGAGSVIGIFAASVFGGMLGYKWFLDRKLAAQQR